MDARYLGLIDYSEARKLQDELIAERLQGHVADTILYCEHPPVVTLGRRTDGKHLLLAAEVIEREFGRIERVSRGGSVTLHLPGQLVIYPVISLTARRIGVKHFVETGLRAISSVVASLGVPCQVKLSPAGVWTMSEGKGSVGGDAPPGKKLAQVGLQVVRGVTNHGFAVNLSCDLAPFRMIAPCGLAAEAVSSVAVELEQSCASPIPNVEVCALVSMIHSALDRQL